MHVREALRHISLYEFFRVAAFIEHHKRLSAAFSRAALLIYWLCEHLHLLPWQLVTDVDCNEELASYLRSSNDPL